MCIWKIEKLNQIWTNRVAKCNGEIFRFSPEKMKMKFCPWCGKEIQLIDSDSFDGVDTQKRTPIPPEILLEMM